MNTARPLPSSDASRSAFTIERSKCVSPSYLPPRTAPRSSSPNSGRRRTSSIRPKSFRTDSVSRSISSRVTKEDARSRRKSLASAIPRIASSICAVL